MDAIKGAAKPQRVRVGGPLGILLVVDSAPLLLRMAEVVRSLEGVRLLGTFGSESQAVDWMLWNRQPWHFAFVDMGLQQGNSEDVVERLLALPRPGTLVALVDHLWREVREKCAALGMDDLLEKGDVIAFRSYLESRLH